jgi:hypothetical protein
MFQLLLRLLGRKTATDIQPFSLSPAEIPYRKAETIVTIVAAERCRSNFLGLSVQDSPFVQILSQNDSGYEGSALETFYQTFKPATVGDLLGLETSEIASMPAMSAVMPWWNRKPEQRLEQVAIRAVNGRFLGKEAIKLGASEQTDFGWQYYGPVSTTVGKMEYERQVSVFRSIRDQGFQPTSATQIHGEFLVSGEDWVWVNIGGKHRLNSLVALGHPEIQVSAKGKYGPVITRRSESSIWPNVQNGLFEEKEALELFDRILAGRGPEIKPQ